MASNSRFAVGVHVLTFLANRNSRPAASSEIARSVNAHPVVLRRLLGALVRGGLVRPVRGATGGFLLAQKSQEIKLSDLYRALETGPALSLPRKAPNRFCPVGCKMQPVVSRVCDEAERAIEAALAQMSLAEVHRRVLRVEAPGVTAKPKKKRH